MRRLTMLLIPLLVLALVITTVGCGGDDEEKPAPTPTAVGATPSPGGETPTPGYTGGKHTFKVAHVFPVNSVVNSLWEYADERLQYYTDGQVKLEIFPMGSLYGAFEMWDALATGALDIGSLVDYNLQMAGFNDYQIGYLNFFWGDTLDDAPDHDRRFWEHPDGGKTLFSLVEPTGVKIIEVMPGDHIQVIMNKFGMKNMAEMKNHKILTVGGLTGLFPEYAGAQQVMIDHVEFAIAFQQGLADLLATTPDTAYSQRLYETGKDGLVLSGLVGHTFFGMNLDLWDSLSPELQDIIENKLIPEIVERGRVEIPAAAEEALRKLEEEGVTLTYVTYEERISFRDGSWELAKERGFLDGMSAELLKLADRLRNEPYDQGELFP